jgi:hypothetical protein
MNRHTPASESTTPKTRRSTPRSVKALRNLITDIDALSQNEDIRPSKKADLLLEKSTLTRALINAEAEVEESGQAEKISTLKQQHEADQRRMSELTAENRRLTSAPIQIERIPDPGASNVRWERDGLKSALNALAKTLTLDQKAQAAVAFAQMCQPQEKVESFCRTIGLEYSQLTYTLPLSVETLEAAQGRTGVGGCLARAVLRAKFPTPAVEPKEPKVEPAKTETPWDVTSRVRAWSQSL